jgi:nicotinate-nucleotide--dimethylbenzimidazole phosphoribosyltransferase
VSFEERVRELAGDVVPFDEAAVGRARELDAGLAKPPGSLGRLEDLGVRLAGMARVAPPPVPEESAVIVAAGDHGVLARGVSPWPREVTAAMVRNFCSGGAAVNALAKTVGARLSVIDVGVSEDLEAHPLLRRMKVRPGTGDLSVTAAMTREEASRAIMAGAGVAGELVESGGVDLLVTGDMGIGNTTPAAALISAFSGRPPHETTGRGTGIDDERLKLKTEIVERALSLHGPDPDDPIGVLAAVGGLEHAALAGVILAGAAYGVPVVLDGVVSNAAALAAAVLAPDAVHYVIPGHISAEPGAAAALEHLGLDPLLDLDMRLGEGTGGLLAVPLVQGAARVLSGMAALEEIA